MIDKLKYKAGGALIRNARVQIVCWGSEWNQAAPKQTAIDLVDQLTRLFSGPYMRGLSQYNVLPATIAQIPIFDVTTNPPQIISTAVIGNYLKTVIGSQGIDDYRNNDQLLYLVVTLNRQWNTPNVGGFHSWDNIAGKIFHWGWIMQISSGFASHEIIEACTDPEASGWLQPENGIEVGDICEDSGNIGVADGVEAAIYWSNVDGSCIIPHRTAKVTIVPDPSDECIGPHVGGKSKFKVSFGVEPSWIDIVDIPLANAHFKWDFDPSVCAPLGASTGPVLELTWTKESFDDTISVTITADGGIDLSATIKIKHVLNAQETQLIIRMCELRKLISTTALLPPPVPDTEGPIIATIMPTPSEINRLRGLSSRLIHKLDQISVISGNLETAKFRNLGARQGM